ncbi:coproporphyrinogen III oxidase family protein [Clostridium tetani]|uniref:STM4012 family radical SAM protein n=1 Tax=Clostridium tetani TaxID=1513 RepID=UPI00100B6985|nr:STM4012 family radical SAM protein [Clostridium tetani]RXI51521.1 coproporphyrinogen III oxidase family protein [Clostridium tetani]RXI56174.1 coproporphyrinogen III oxidase family protein [Clostridium tetani]
MTDLEKYIEENPYKSYIYSYPHKKSYRTFDKAFDLKKLWENRKSDNLTLYIHIPFCLNKCGYCNLFSTTDFNKDKMSKYVDKLIEEIKAVKNILDLKKESVVGSVIFGGGTPTALPKDLMEKLLIVIEKDLNIDFKKIFFSMETSPNTMSKEYIDLLKKFHINRISMGIQSFKECELKEIYRFETVNNINKSLELMKKENIEIKNLDLIYGIPSQSMESFMDSLKRVIEYRPEEIFIYPLYIREKTKLYEKYKRDFNKMTNMYELAKDELIKNGYIQTSMRNFIREDMNEKLYPSYSCQENEMIGIGCGARAYISNIHYSRKYAVNQSNINSIINNYLKEENLYYATYGYILSEDEIKRKYILKSILKVTGLDLEEYFKRFNKNIFDDFNEINLLIDKGFLIKKGTRVYPTEKGLKYSDAMGCLFISNEVNKKTQDFSE